MWRGRIGPDAAMAVPALELAAQDPTRATGGSASMGMFSTTMTADHFTKGTLSAGEFIPLNIWLRSVCSSLKNEQTNLYV